MQKDRSGPTAPIGYSTVPPGHVAAVVTFLEMRQRPDLGAAAQFPPDFELLSLRGPTLDRYRALFRTVGQDWLWFSRLTMSDDELRSILDDRRVHVFALRRGADDVGILELDFRQPNACELAFFGLISDVIGQGIGKILMHDAIERAWAQEIERLWVHTCTFDHPKAVGFYRNAGFIPYAFEVEVQIDPRLTGAVPRTCAPHVPLLE